MSSLDLAALDLLPAQIAILDRTGAIVGTNRSWDDTAQRGCLRLPSLALNYLDECRAAAERGCEEGGRIASGITQVLGGAASVYSCTYPCAFEGMHHWYQATVSPAGQAGAVVVMHVDVTAREHDPLTDLANRALFEAQAEYVLQTAIDERSEMGILLIDLDRFKPVNDRFGHLAGDHVLRSVAARLKASMRSGDLAARFGGDEFGIVLAAGSGAGVAEKMMRRIQSALEEPIPYQDQSLAVGISIGAGCYPADGSSVSELLAAADARMYAMKTKRLI